MSSRISQTISAGPEANMSRRSQTRFDMDKGAGNYQAATIGFTAPGTITDSANGMGLYGINDEIEIRGSALNSRKYVVLTAGAGSLTVLPPVLTTEAAGPAIIMLRDS